MPDFLVLGMRRKALTVARIILTTSFMITSKLTSKAQTTIPQAVRAALGVHPGDEIAYAIAEGHVLLTKAAPIPPRRGTAFEDPFAAFREWDTPEDDEAFADL